MQLTGSAEKEGDQVITLAQLLQTYQNATIEEIEALIPTAVAASNALLIQRGVIIPDETPAEGEGEPVDTTDGVPPEGEPVDTTDGVPPEGDPVDTTEDTPPKGRTRKKHE